jgi:hypothetical protein
MTFSQKVHHYQLVLVCEFQPVASINIVHLKNIDALSAGQRNKINDNLDELYLSKRLAEIHTQVTL